VLPRCPGGGRASISMVENASLAMPFMQQRRLGRTHLQLPVIGLGTWATFDTDTDRAPLVGEALSVGVRLFDSSPMYGKAEATLAAALGNRRAEAIVATKIAANDSAVAAAQAQQSLALFGTVDVYQIHNVIAWEQRLPLLEELKAEGRVTAIGATQGLSVSDDEFMKVMRTGRIDCIQVRYNPARPRAVKEILPLAASLGIGVLVMQPLRWGVLLAAPTDEERKRLGGIEWAEAVLRWIVSDPRVTSVLTATSTLGRTTCNAKAGMGLALTPEQRDLVERIVERGPPPPGGASARSLLSRNELITAAAEFLTAQKGAAYCDGCLGRALGVFAAVAADVRSGLPETFVRENAPCLICGGPGPIARARTLIR
jgi:aryl-alcohol dehydrogenase-like predicted oxidoreductase